MRLVHYGNLNGGQIIPSEMTDAYVYTKPRCKGLLWTSPIDSPWGWKDRCLDDEPDRLDGKKVFELELSDTAKTATVDSFADLEALAEIYPHPVPSSKRQNLDWLRLSQDFDVFWLTNKGQWATRNTYPLTLCGFDCETVLIFNTSLVAVVKVLKEGEQSGESN